MTHTLHRQGTVENLTDDFPMLTIRARGHNDGGLWRMQRILEMASRYPIVNFGDIKNGSKFTTTLDQILGSSDPNLPILHMVFTSKEDATRFLRDLKEADLGVSVVASGLFEEIFQCCRKAGITPHTANYSLGVHGRTEKLPPREVLEITTMCGIDHTPKDEKVKIKMGEAFDVVGERTQRDWKKIAWNLYETEWDVEVRNHKKEDTEVTIIEPVPGDWEVVKSSHPYTKVEAHTLQYAVKVPKDGKVTVNYRVRMRW